MTEGLFWVLNNDGDIAKRGSKVKAASGPRSPKRSLPPSLMPPLPDTGWLPPESFPELHRTNEIMVLDVETCDPDLEEKGPGVRRKDTSYMVGIAVRCGEYTAYYPFAHECGGNMDKERVLAYFREVVSNPNQPKLFANSLYDLDWLAEYGIFVKGVCFDVQIAAPLIDETEDSYKLDVLSKKYGRKGKVIQAIEDWSKKAFGANSNFAENIYRTPPTLAGPYAEGDVDETFHVFKAQYKELKTSNLIDIFKLETRVTPMLLGMRRVGVRVDLEGTLRMSEHLQGEKENALNEIKRLTGYLPEIYTPESLEILCTKAGIDFPRTAKTGKASFKKDWLSKHPHPVMKLLQQAREVDKLDGTFLQGHILSNHINGRIHTQFHQLRTDENGAVSGRFSSSNPNLQNIPTRSALGKLIRKLFLPNEGEDWWSRDWSQVEYRLLVHYAAWCECVGAEDAVQAYTLDRETDFHKMVAALTGLSRADAKNFNFGMVYSQGIRRIASILKISVAEARELSNTYHSRAPYIRELSQRVQKAAGRDGEIRTLLGRRRLFNRWEDPNLGRDEATGRSKSAIFKSKDQPWYVRAFVYAALNAEIQGSAADLMKEAMAQIYEAGICDVLGYPSLTVHDELDGSKARTPIADEALKDLHFIMENCVPLRVPLLADGGEGPTWGDAK